MDTAPLIDPECTELKIYDFNLSAFTPTGSEIDAPRTLDGWRALGNRIGQHENLKRLGLGPFDATAESESLGALLRGMSQNKSLRSLRLFQCRGNWPLEILASSFKNLLSLTVDECNLSRRAISSLSIALRGCPGCSLKNIRWSRSTMGDETAVEFITSLAGLSRLNYLKLVACDIGPRGCSAMSALLRNPDCTLESVRISRNKIGNEGLDALGLGLRDNRTLITLVLDNIGNITTEAWQSFSGVLRYPTCTLEHLGLWGIIIDDNAMVTLADASRGNTRLKDLWLGNRIISSIRWAQLFGGEQMNRNIVPHVLSWLGGHGLAQVRAQKSNCTAVYGFLRKMPTLFGNSCRVVRRSMRKRKAQS